METVMSKHQEMQETIARDMMAMTKTLKDHSMTARDIIKTDSQVGDMSTAVYCVHIDYILYSFTMQLMINCNFTHTVYIIVKLISLYCVHAYMCTEITPFESMI